jgi:hypothetical protein
VGLRAAIRTENQGFSVGRSPTSATTAGGGLVSIAAVRPISDLVGKRYQSACRRQSHEKGYQGRMQGPMKPSWLFVPSGPPPTVAGTNPLLRRKLGGTADAQQFDSRSERHQQQTEPCQEERPPRNTHTYLSPDCTQIRSAVPLGAAEDRSLQAHHEPSFQEGPSESPLKQGEAIA